MTDQAIPVKTVFPVAPGQLFGHPKGLTILFMTEAWERFSYFGMSALLVLYMVKHVFQPEFSGGVIGYGALRAVIESVRGPLDTQSFATMVASTYTAFAYLTPILGGLIADRILGQRRTALVGLFTMACAHFMLAFEQTFLVALATLICGNGMVKPNISTQVGGLYRTDDPRIDRAYSIYYIGINIGAFLAPIVSGTLANAYGWRYGFIACGCGMLIGIAVYLSGWRTLPVGDPPKARRARGPAAPLDAKERQAVTALIAVFIIVIFFWATFDQQYSTMMLWNEFLTDRTVNLGFWRGEIPATYFLAINPLMIFIATPLIVRLWAVQAQRGTESSTFTKMGWGMMWVAVANLIMVAAAWMNGPDGRAHWLWAVTYYAVLTVGELYLAPIGLALVSKMAPARILSMMMGLWLATTFPGDLLAGWLGSFWTAMAKSAYFMMIAAIAALAGAAMWMIGPKLNRLVAGGSSG